MPRSPVRRRAGMTIFSGPEVTLPQYVDGRRVQDFAIDIFIDPVLTIFRHRDHNGTSFRPPPFALDWRGHRRVPCSAVEFEAIGYQLVTAQAKVACADCAAGNGVFRHCTRGPKGARCGSCRWKEYEGCAVPPETGAKNDPAKPAQLRIQREELDSNPAHDRCDPVTPKKSMMRRVRERRRWLD
ncbi:hypothetical protein KEM52_003129 [Ascosphaera acerosa]|nr:hypothetical protein KEM52_003129 [Ascosphaera acerosa]